MLKELFRHRKVELDLEPEPEPMSESRTWLQGLYPELDLGVLTDAQIDTLLSESAGSVMAIRFGDSRGYTELRDDLVALIKRTA